MTPQAIISASPILTWLIALPTIGAGLTLFLPAGKTRIIRDTGLLFMLLTLGLAIVAAALFNWNVSAAGDVLQLTHKVPWIKVLSAHYVVGVDGLSMPLVLLAAGMGLLVCFASRAIERQVKGYYVLLLLVVALTLGALVAQDLLLFYVYGQLVMVPLYFLIGLWGGTNKEAAAGKFFIFMTVSGIILLLGILSLHACVQGITNRPFDLSELTSSRAVAGAFMPREAIERFFGVETALASDGSGAMHAGLIFWLFVASFAIVMPAAGVHTWMVDTLVEAPTPVAMLLAGVTLNLGGYGLFRIVYPIFPHQVAQYWWWIALGGVVTIIYGALCALAQKDLKRLVAYASLSQMGYVLLGFAVLTPAAAHGAVFMLVAHGINIALLLFVAGVIEQRAHHCQIDRLGGLGTQMPGYSTFAAIGFFAAMGLPGFCTFVGQILVLFGAFSAAGIDPKESPLAQPGAHNTQLSLMVFAVLAAASSILTAGYLLWALQRIFMGPPRPEHHHFGQLLRYERIVLLVLCAAIIVLGVYPTPLVTHLPPFGHTIPHVPNVAGN